MNDHKFKKYTLGLVMPEELLHDMMTNTRVKEEPFDFDRDDLILGCEEDRLFAIFSWCRPRVETHPGWILKIHHERTDT